MRPNLRPATLAAIACLFFFAFAQPTLAAPPLELLVHGTASRLIEDEAGVGADASLEARLRVTPMWDLGCSARWGTGKKSDFVPDELPENPRVLIGGQCGVGWRSPAVRTALALLVAHHQMTGGRITGYDTFHHAFDDPGGRPPMWGVGGELSVGQTWQLGSGSTGPLLALSGVVAAMAGGDLFNLSFGLRLGVGLGLGRPGG